MARDVAERSVAQEHLREQLDFSKFERMPVVLVQEHGEPRQRAAAITTRRPGTPSASRHVARVVRSASRAM